MSAGTSAVEETVDAAEEADAASASANQLLCL